MKNHPFVLHRFPAAAIAIAAITWLLVAPLARSAPASSDSAAFTLDTRNLVDSPIDATVHTDNTAYKPDDTVPGSLRQAIANAVAGETVDFDGGLDGQTLKLESEIFLTDRELTIDASALIGGVTLNGDAGNPGESADNIRFFNLQGASDVTIEKLILEDGNSAGNRYDFGSGGAIFAGVGTTLRVDACQFHGNRATNGTVSIENSIVAGNTADSSANLAGTITQIGNNLTTGDPFLGPLADNGGATQTMALLTGSPANDAGVATGTTPATDQRGDTRPLDGDSDTTATVDLGAVEMLPGFVPSLPGGTIRSAAGSQELTWNDLGAPMYRLYLGTDTNDVGNAMPDSSEDKGTVVGNGFVPSPVSSGGTYYWRVDTVFGDLEIPGAVQSFGTITPQPDTRIGTKGNPSTYKEIAKVTLKGRRTGKLYASVRNDGDNTDALKLSRIAANKTLKLKSFRLTGGRQNITAALKRGSYVTPALAPGEWVVIQTQAKAKKTKARQTLKYIAASQVVPAVVDGAKGKVKSGKK